MSNVSNSLPFDSQAIHVFAVLVFLLVIIVGILCNMVLCYVILKTKSLRTHLNSYIVNIAMADLLTCFVLIPFRIVAATENPWNINLHMVCGGEMFLRVTTDVSKLFFLGCVSYERYLAIANPFNRDKKIPKLRAVISTCVIWCIAAGLASFATIRFNNVTLMEECEFDEKSHSHGDVEVYVITPIFLLTVVLITLFYILIIRILMEHGSTMSKHLGGKPKNKVKPTEDTIPASSTTREHSVQIDSQIMPSKAVSMITLVAEHSSNHAKEQVVESPTPKPESAPNCNGVCKNSTLCVVPVIETSSGDDNHNTTITSKLVYTDVTPVELNDQQKTCVSRKNGIINHNHLNPGLSDAGQTSSITSKLNVCSDVTEQDSKLVKQSKANTESLELNQVSRCVESGESNIPNDKTMSVNHNAQVDNAKIANSENNLVENYSFAKEGSPEISEQIPTNTIILVKDKTQVALDDLVKSKTHNQEPDNCEVLISEAQLLVNDDHLEQNKTVDTQHKELLTIKNDLPQNGILLISDKTKLTENDTHLPENKTVLIENKGKQIENENDLQNHPVSIEEKTKLIVNENNFQNKPALTEDKTKLIENESHALQNTTAVSETVCNSTKESKESQKDVEISETTSMPIVSKDKISETTSMPIVNKDKISETTAMPIVNKDEISETTAMPIVNKEEISETTAIPIVNKDVLLKKESSMTVKQTRNKSSSLMTKRPGKKEVSVVAMDGSVHKESLSNASGAVCKRDDANKIRGRRKVELKAAKRIIAVIGTFFILWIPFPVCVLLSRKMIRSESDHAMWLPVMLLMSSVSVVASAVMPLLSGLSNKQIKSAALRIYQKHVCARCKKVSTS